MAFISTGFDGDQLSCIFITHFIEGCASPGYLITQGCDPTIVAYGGSKSRILGPAEHHHGSLTQVYDCKVRTTSNVFLTMFDRRRRTRILNADPHLR